MATVTVNKSVSDVNALVGRGLVSVRCVSGARPMRGVGEPRVRPAAAPRRRHRTHGWGDNSFDTVLTGWQAADMTYGIESPFTR